MKMKNIAVLCSGGDSPGMNPAIRAVIRTGLGNGLKVYGIHRGFDGLIHSKFKEMDLSSVGNIIQRGGTILGSSRCPEFHEKEFRQQAAKILKSKKIDGLVIIGGNGSFNGAMALWKEHKIPVVGIPGTIDNDVSGTDYTIGFDTASQTAVEAVDKIRDTALSHERTFLVEVMGRKSASLALNVAICSGAENVIVSSKYDLDEIVKRNKLGRKRGKKSSIIIVAESDTPGLSYKIQEELLLGHDIKAGVCILGHIQRGGTPTVYDRVVATKMGHLAVQSLIDANFPSATVLKNGTVGVGPLEKCLKNRKASFKEKLDIIKALSI
ncbi:MAG: ATP-dependent 6-phosphofructokinase [Bacteriovoracaceae bacterium]